MTGFKYNKIRVCNILNSVKSSYLTLLYIVCNFSHGTCPLMVLTWIFPRDIF